MTTPIKRVAVIGAGPSGAITLDALMRERSFDVVRVFERRERPGGVWLFDPEPTTSLPIGIHTKHIDRPVQIPNKLPCYTPKNTQERFAHTATYGHLETNVDARAMGFTEEPVEGDRTIASITMYGELTPFRHHSVMQRYVEQFCMRNGYGDHILFNTTVEKAVKEGDEWVLTLRREGESSDYWWQERFDAVVVASGHYSVPIIPNISGLEEYAKKHHGAVTHTKSYRGAESYRGKNVVVVGGSVSAMETAIELVNVVKRLDAVIRSPPHPFFGHTVFSHPRITRHPEIKSIDAEKRIVHFVDDTSVDQVDHIILGTGFQYSYPFLENVCLNDNRVNGLYLHVFNIEDPTLAFVGAIGAGLTFKAYEWQAVLTSRFFAGRAQLPSQEDQHLWESERVAKRGNGANFTALFPDFKEYFEFVRLLAGNDGPGRKLPKFDPKWVHDYNVGHQLRIRQWEKQIAEATKQIGDEYKFNAHY